MLPNSEHAVLILILYDELYINRGSFGSRPSDHYFRSVCLFVCLFVQSFSQPPLIRFGSN